MVTFQNSKSFLKNKLSEQDKTVSTLLVPTKLLNQLIDKKREHGNRFDLYFHNLLSMYRTLTHSGMIPDPRKIKTEYQEEGLALKRISFRPRNSDWIELGELGLAFGKSRCWMFTFLLEIDIAGLWDLLLKFGMNNVVPTKKNVRLRVSWSLWHTKHTFTRSYHVKV